MKRLIIVYNPRSSRYADVEREVLARAKELNGFTIGKYEVAKTDVDDNARKLSKILADEDIVLAAGGDATAAIAVNAVMLSKKDVKLAALPYGNFNDLARTLNTKNFDEVFKKKTTTKNFYPLEIKVDGKFFRFASCYVTIGMTAEAVEIFDEPKVRKSLNKKIGRKIGSYINLMKWYFRNRRKKEFLPEFSVNGTKQKKKTSDYAAVNGKSMARVMKGGDDYLRPKIFRSETERTVKLWPLIKLMTKSILVRVPGHETTGDTIEFTKPANVELQAEGEYQKFKNVQKIEIKKAERCFKTIQIL